MRSAEQRLRSVGERLGSFEGAIERAQERPESLTDGARQLLERTTALVKSMRDGLQARWDALEAIAEPGREQDRQALCDDFRDLIREISTQLMPVLSGAQAVLVPVELESLVRHLVTAVAPTTIPVLYGVNEPNYSIRGFADPLGRWQILLGGAQAAAANEDFAFLSLPAFERDSSALHCILLGHELGHLQDWRQDIGSSIPVAWPAEYLDGAGKIRDDHTAAIVFDTVTRGWISELVADVLAAAQLGPAALFSLIELVGNLIPLTADTMTHPGPDRRVALMLRVLRRQRWYEIDTVRFLLEPLERECGDAFSRAVSSIGALPTEGAQRAWDAVRTQLDALEQAAVARAIDPLSDDDWPAVNDCADAFLNGLVCGESRDTSPRARDGRIVLNGVWFAKLGELASLGAILGENTSTLSGRAHASNTLDTLGLKSIEISDFRRSTS